ncbi:MAG: hypothetical protein HQ559_16580, partial [Lentisphaerae bacterium]|nr:hypothetical protein [Lentisphaerota bacterium]
METALTNPGLILPGDEDRTGVYPATQLAEFYSCRINPRSKNCLGTAAGSLLQAWIVQPPPTEQARKELLYFLAKTCPPEARPSLQAVIDDLNLLPATDPELHVRLLAALLDFQESMDPE